MEKNDACLCSSKIFGHFERDVANIPRCEKVQEFWRRLFHHSYLLPLATWSTYLGIRSPKCMCGGYSIIHSSSLLKRGQPTSEWGIAKFFGDGYSIIYISSCNVVNLGSLKWDIPLYWGDGYSVTGIFSLLQCGQSTWKCGILICFCDSIIDISSATWSTHFEIRNSKMSRRRLFNHWSLLPVVTLSTYLGMRNSKVFGPRPFHH